MSPKQAKVDAEIVEAMADKAQQYFELGEEAIRCDRMARAVRKDDSCPDVSPGVAMAAVRRVRDELRNRGHFVHLLSQSYFDAPPDERSPESLEKARRLLPIGYGDQSVGVRAVPKDAEKDDVLWVAMETWNGITKMGGVRHVSDRVVDGIRREFLTPSVLVDLVDEYVRVLTGGEKLPRHLANRIADQLSGGSDENDGGDAAAALPEGGGGRPTMSDDPSGATASP